jgi:Protein kinase domain
VVGLRDRVEAVGGTMTLDSPAGVGTVLTARLPITTDDHLSERAVVHAPPGASRRSAASQPKAGVAGTGGYRDITAANVVISRDGAPCLVDFALAAPLGEIRPEFTHHSEIAGTLAYLAPEATGRTGRPVDQRADLYALGATLYELATGGPPFGTGDPLRLTHDHLARVPVPSAEVHPAVPALLSAVIVHLLEKEPDHRYQSADGVLHDLEQVRHTQAGLAAAPVRSATG